jgi:hypothetical protein
MGQESCFVFYSELSTVFPLAAAILPQLLLRHPRRSQHGEWLRQISLFSFFAAVVKSLHCRHQILNGGSSNKLMIYYVARST